MIYTRLCASCASKDTLIFEYWLRSSDRYMSMPCWNCGRKQHIAKEGEVQMANTSVYGVYIPEAVWLAHEQCDDIGGDVTSI